MNKSTEQISMALFGVAHLEDVPLEQLEELVQNYPSFTVGHFLLASRMREKNMEAYSESSRKTALYFHNPFWLQWLLQDRTAEADLHVVAKLPDLPFYSEHQDSPPAVSPVQWSAHSEKPAEMMDFGNHFPEDMHPEQAVADIPDILPSPVTTGAEQEAPAPDMVPEDTGLQFEETLPGQPEEPPVPETPELPPEDRPSFHIPEEENPILLRASEMPPDSGISVQETPEPMFPEDPGSMQEKNSSGPAAETLLPETRDPGPGDLLPGEAPLESEGQSPVNLLEQEPNGDLYSEPESSPPLAEAHPEQSVIFTEAPAAILEDVLTIDGPVEESLPIPESFSPVPEENREFPSIDTLETAFGTEPAPSPPSEEVFLPANEFHEEIPAESGSEPTAGIPDTETEPDNPTGEFSIHSETLPSFHIPLNLLDLTSPPNEGGPLFDPYHTIDYFASQGIRFVQDENPSDKFGKQLKSFTDWLRILKRVPPKTEEEESEEIVDSQVESIAAHSLEDKDTITETMATVLARQGKNEKAIEIYEKLSLLFPGKSAYFAARIAELKNI
jgi:hypothetical protein